MKQRHHRTDPILRWLRFHFTGMEPDIDEPEGGQRVLAILAESKPAYVARFWSDHDAINRRRAAEQKEFLDRYGERMARRLALFTLQSGLRRLSWIS